MIKAYSVLILDISCEKPDPQTETTSKKLITNRKWETVPTEDLEINVINVEEVSQRREGWWHNLAAVEMKTTGITRKIKTGSAERSKSRT